MNLLKQARAAMRKHVTANNPNHSHNPKQTGSASNPIKQKGMINPGALASPKVKRLLGQLSRPTGGEDAWINKINPATIVSESLDRLKADLEAGGPAEFDHATMVDTVLQAVGDIYGDSVPETKAGQTNWDNRVGEALSAVEAKWKAHLMWNRKRPAEQGQGDRYDTPHNDREEGYGPG